MFQVHLVPGALEGTKDPRESSVRLDRRGRKGIRAGPDCQDSEEKREHRDHRACQG